MPSESMAGESGEGAAKYVKRLLDKETTLLEIIKSMEESLNSEALSARQSGLFLLASIIEALPENFLSQMEASVILGYLNALLKGHPDTAKIAIRAIKSLFAQQPVPPPDAATFVESFFNEVELVDLTKEDKMYLYQLFHSLLTNTSYLTDLKRMESAIIPGILQLIELETDPQCLMLCFAIFQIVVSHFPLGHYVEEMFEFPAAYFPIDFNAPPERHGGVTRDLLQGQVEKCLLSHDAFGENVFKLCIEKISSDYPEAQLEGLQLLKQTIQRFDAKLSSEYLGAVWSLLRKLHIGHCEDLTYQERILRATTVLSGKISESGGLDELGRFADMLWKDFDDNEAFLQYNGWRLIVAFAGGSPLSGAVILPRCLDKITSMLSDEKQINATLLDASSAFVELVASATELHSDARPSVEMLIAQASSLLLNPSFSAHHIRIVDFIGRALPLKGVFGQAQIECIRRFIESSIDCTNDTSQKTLKKFIARCNSHFGPQFVTAMRELALNRKSAWLLAGLVDSSGANAAEISGELLSIGNPSAFVCVREIVLSFPDTSSALYASLLKDQTLDQNDEYVDLLSVIVRASDELSNTAALISLNDSPASQKVLLDLRIVLSNCQIPCLTPEIAMPLTSKIRAIEGPKGPILDQCLALIANKTASVPELPEDPFTVAHLAKGLLLGGHEGCDRLLGVAMDNITRSSDGPAAFATIAKDESAIFPRHGHCIVKLLHSQRFLSISMKRLLADFEESLEKDRSAIASAICLLIHHTRPDLVSPYMEKLAPVIKWCLTATTMSPESTIGFLQCLRRSLPHLCLNINVLLPPLLRWIERPHSMTLRTEALLTIFEVRKHFETHLLLPHKKKVIKALPVGDRKRLVRRAASQASSTWHMLGEA